MSGSKKLEVKKSLVRNALQPLPKTVVIEESANGIKSCKDAKKVEMAKNTKVGLLDPSQFDLPELYSAMKLSRKMDEIVKPRKTKSLSDVDPKKRLAVDEKVSRNVNFPIAQPIYKNLIPLSMCRVETPPVLNNRVVVLPKFKEPNLADFIKPREVKDYYYKPSVKIENRPINFIQNNLRLYSVLQVHTDD